MTPLGAGPLRLPGFAVRFDCRASRAALTSATRRWELARLWAASAQMAAARSATSREISWTADTSSWPGGSGLGHIQHASPSEKLSFPLCHDPSLAHSPVFGAVDRSRPGSEPAVVLECSAPRLGEVARSDHQVGPVLVQRDAAVGKPRPAAVAELQEPLTITAKISRAFSVRSAGRNTDSPASSRLTRSNSF
jgi:hypothetical protein